MSAATVEIEPGTVAAAFLHHNEISGGFMSSLYKLIGADERVMFPPIMNQCNTDIASGRNQCVAAFLNQTPCEWMLFLDDDMGFAPDLLERLMAAAHPKDRPVVGGLCFAYKRYEVTVENAERFVVRPTIYKYVETEKQVGFSNLDEYERDAVVEVDATGAACLLIHRSVLLGMLDAVGPNWFSHVTVPKGPGGQTTMSEDLSFCMRLKAAGIPIYVDTSAKLSHRKPVYLDEWYFDNQPVRSEEPPIVIVGTGRSGTGFISSVLSSCGVTTGHEQWWNPFGVKAPGLMADASWVATNYLDEYEGKVWHQVRHPLAVIRSMLSGPLFDPEAPEWVEPFETERRRWAGYDLNDPPEVKALRVVAHWWQMAEKHAERTWRLEDVTPGLIVELVDQVGKSVALRFCRLTLDAHGTDTNKHESGSEIVWADLPDNEDKAAIVEMAEAFGYDLEVI